MSAKLDEKRLKLAAQGLRKTAISLQAAVVSLLQAAEALTTETDHLVEYNPLDVNLQDLLKGDINSALSKLLNDVLNNDNALYEDQKTQNGKQTANGVKKSRKPRPPRDPDAPIRPQNAYIFFQKDVSNQVKEENKGKPWSEIVHLISTRWKALPKEDREIYEHRFKEARQNYEIEYKAYMQKKGQEAVADADGADGHENNITDSATPNSASTTSHSEDENEEEEEEEDTPNLSNARSSRSKAKSAKIAQPDPESSKKKSKKRKLHAEDDDESAHEEEYELPKKSKKKTSNEEGSDVQGKERKKFKKISDVEVGKFKKKKNKKKKQE